MWCTRINNYETLHPLNEFMYMYVVCTLSGLRSLMRDVFSRKFHAKERLARFVSAAVESSPAT